MLLELAFTGRCPGGFKRRSRKAKRSNSFFFFPGCPDSAVSQGDAKASQCMFQNRGDSVGDFPEQILGSEKQTPSSPSALRLGVEAGGRLAWNALTRK